MSDSTEIKPQVESAEAPAPMESSAQPIAEAPATAASEPSSELSASNEQQDQKESVVASGSPSSDNAVSHNKSVSTADAAGAETANGKIDSASKGPVTKRPRKRGTRTRRRRAPRRGAEGDDDGESDEQGSGTDEESHDDDASSVTSAASSASSSSSRAGRRTGQPDRSGGEEEDPTPRTSRTPDDKALRPSPMPGQQRRKGARADGSAPRNSSSSQKTDFDLLAEAEAADTGKTGQSGEEIEFDDFSRNGLPTSQNSTTKPSNKDLAEARKAKNKERHEKLKEKRKAKRAAEKQQKAAHQQENPSKGGGQTSKTVPDAEPASKRSPEPAHDTVKPDDDQEQPKNEVDAARQTGGRVTNRQAYQARVATDPKFTPRVGRFWMHDARLYTPGKFGTNNSEYSGLREMSDFWRGRGRGRGGRGGGFMGSIRGGSAGPRSSMLPNQTPSSTGATVQTKSSTGEAVQDSSKAPSSSVTHGASQVNAPPETENPATENAVEDEQQADSQQVTSKASVDTKNERSMFSAGRADEGAWTHDGFFEMQTRMRGRGAARGAFRGVVPPHIQRGGFRGRPPFPVHFARGGRPGFVPPRTNTTLQSITASASNDGRDTQQSEAAGAADQKQPEGPQSVENEPGPSQAGPLVASASHTAISNEADNRPEVINAKVPSVGPAKLVHPKVSPLPPADAANSAAMEETQSTIALNLQLQAEVAALRQQQELMRQREMKLQEDLRRFELGQGRPGSAITGSENGSANGSLPSVAQPSAAIHPPQAQPPFIPPGVGVTDNGNFYDIATGQPLIFLPNGASGSRAPPPQPSYYPQATTPHYDTYSERPSLLTHRSSNGAPSYSPFPQVYSSSGRESPFPPASYFAPPRQSSKIEIRAPEAGDSASVDLSIKGAASSSPYSNQYGSNPMLSNDALRQQYYSMDPQQQMYAQHAQQSQQVSYGYAPYGGYQYQ